MSGGTAGPRGDGDADPEPAKPSRAWLVLKWSLPVLLGAVLLTCWLLFGALATMQPMALALMFLVLDASTYFAAAADLAGAGSALDFARADWAAGPLSPSSLVAVALYSAIALVTVALATAALRSDDTLVSTIDTAAIVAKRRQRRQVHKVVTVLASVGAVVMVWAHASQYSSKAGLTSVPAAVDALYALAFLGPLFMLITALRLWLPATREAMYLAQEELLKRHVEAPVMTRLCPASGLHSIEVGKHIDTVKVVDATPVASRAAGSKTASAPTAPAASSVAAAAKPATAAGSTPAAAASATEHTHLVPAATRPVRSSDLHVQAPPTEVATTSGDREQHIAVLIHGYGMGSALWCFTFDSLLRHFDSVIALDWLGTGLSNRPRFGARTPEEAEDWFVSSLERWRAAHPVLRDGRKFTLVAHSLGGPIATEYTQRYSQYVSHLILASPACVPPPPDDASSGGRSNAHRRRRRGSRPMWRKAIYFLWDKVGTPFQLLRWVGPFGAVLVNAAISRRMEWFPEGSVVKNSPDSVPHVIAYCFHNWGGANSGEGALGTMLLPGVHAKGTPLCERLVPENEVLRHVPLSFVYGGEIDWMSYAHGEDVVARLREGGSPAPARLYNVEDAGHQLYINRPKEFAVQVGRAHSHVLDFVRRSREDELRRTHSGRRAKDVEDAESEWARVDARRDRGAQTS